MPFFFVQRIVVLVIVIVAVCAPAIDAEEVLPFRTDDHADPALPWFQLVEGEFPPEHSSHQISGELIGVDHLTRQFQIRVDRDDSQQKGKQDLPLEAQMLPYGSVHFAGGTASLKDIPLGTHLHGEFYIKDTSDNSKPIKGGNGQTSTVADFRRCIRLEDDFSFYSRQKQIWKVDAIDLDELTLTATLFDGNKALGDSQVFSLVEGTRVYQDRGFSKLQSIQQGQEVLFNITWATLYGPGRIDEIWLDQESRDLATKMQRKKHRVFTRDRGMPGWIDAVDDNEKIVTITFFDSIDPMLFEELDDIDEKPHGWPFSYPEDDPKAPKGGICVALESLMTYDPVNDRKGGNILAIENVPKEPGCSGVQIRVKCGMLLEGFRPGRIVRFYPATWNVVALPREEQYFGRE